MGTLQLHTHKQHFDCTIWPTFACLMFNSWKWWISKRCFTFFISLSLASRLTPRISYSLLSAIFYSTHWSQPRYKRNVLILWCRFLQSPSRHCMSACVLCARDRMSLATNKQLWRLLLSNICNFIKAKTLNNLTLWLNLLCFGWRLTLRSVKMAWHDYWSERDK